MKIKKNFSFTDKNQIWRLLISTSDKLVIETRDTDKKEAFFHCIDIVKGKKIFMKYQLDERFWTGIESLHDDIIYFHSFAKPNMPEHKKIFAYDISQNRIIWKNEDLTFLSVFDKTVYAFKRKFEGLDVFALDHRNGKIIQELGDDHSKVNEIIEHAEKHEDYSDYGYPVLFDNTAETDLKNLITDEVALKLNVENIEYFKYGELLLFNYYVRGKNNLLDNHFAVYNIDKKKKIHSEIINQNLNSFSPDSFFCYKNFLILLKNKTEIVSFIIK